MTEIHVQSTLPSESRISTVYAVEEGLWEGIKKEMNEIPQVTAKHGSRGRQWQEEGPRNTSGSLRRRSPCVWAQRVDGIHKTVKEINLRLQTGWYTHSDETSGINGPLVIILIHNGNTWDNNGTESPFIARVGSFRAPRGV